jgi:hypothetical protein
MTNYDYRFKGLNLTIPGALPSNHYPAPPAPHTPGGGVAHQHTDRITKHTSSHRLYSPDKALAITVSKIYYDASAAPKNTHPFTQKPLTGSHKTQNNQI